MRVLKLFAAMLVWNGVVGKFDDGGLRGGLSGIVWSDWDGKQVCHPLSFSLPESEAEIVELVKKSIKDQSRIKVVGAGHSFSAITLSDGARFIALDRMRNPISIQRNDMGAIVTVQAGMRLFELNDFLAENDLALTNMGATAEQSIAGAISTGTHGTGKHLGSISTQIVGLRFVDGRGQTVEAYGSSSLLNAGRVSLGVLGIITEVSIQVENMFNLQMDTISINYEHLEKILPDMYDKYDRMQWYFFPLTNQNATLLLRERTSEKVTEPGCWGKSKAHHEPHTHRESGGIVVSSCTDLSFKALGDSRDGYMKRKLYTEMEMFIPVRFAQPAIRDFVEFLGSIKDTIQKPESVFTGVRYVGQDDIWLSPQYKRNTAVISLIVEGDQHETGNQTLFEQLGRELERITTEKYEGVPHWGKQNYLADACSLSRQYAEFSSFTHLRRTMDPHDLFLNEYLSHRLGDCNITPFIADFFESEF